MKRIVTFVLTLSCTLVIIAAFTGCGSGASPESSGGTANVVKPSVDLSQIDWTVESGIIDGERTVVFGYTNNTDYEIVDFDLEFKVKDNVTNEQLEAYSELKEKAEDMDHDIGGITVSAITHKCVAPGESIDGLACNLDGTIEYYCDFDSFEMFEPDMLTAVIASEDKLYMAYYDFASSKTTMGDDVEDAYTWSDSELAKTVPKPDVRYLTTTYDEDDYLSAEAFDVSEEKYEAYVEACKEMGFNKNVDEYDDMFSAENTDGISVDLGYVSSDDQLYITVEKGDE